MEARLREALRFLLLSAEERVCLTRQAEKTQVLTPSLDDGVMNELSDRGFIELRTCAQHEIPHGASVATDGHGGIAVVEVTFIGRAWMQSS
jgi:hypothetical protein